MNRLFLANLPHGMKRDKLKTVFAKYGAIDGWVRYGRAMTGFVDFESKEGARAALKEMDGSIIQGRKIIIRYADPWNVRRGDRRRPATPPQVLAEEEEKPQPQLPPECIAHIAKFLTYPDRARMEMISKTWRNGSLMSHGSATRLTMDDWRWRECAEHSEAHVTTVKLYWALHRCGARLRRLDLSGEANLQSQIVKISVSTCPNLERLTVYPLTIRQAALREMAGLTKLKYLKLGTVLGPVDDDLRTLLDNNAT